MPTEFFIKGSNTGQFSLVDTFEKPEDLDYEIILSTYQTNIPGFNLEGFVDYLTKGRKDIVELEKEVKIYIPQNPQVPSTDATIIQKLLDTSHGLVYMGVIEHQMPEGNKNLLQIFSAGNYVPAVRFAHVLMHNICLMINDQEGYDALLEDDTPKYLPDDEVIKLLKDVIMPVFARYTEKNNTSYPLNFSA